MTQPQPSPEHFTLRYLEGTHIRDRKHRFTVVRASTWLEAEQVRLAAPQPYSDLLEVVVRGGAR